MNKYTISSLTDNRHLHSPITTTNKNYSYYIFLKNLFYFFQKLIIRLKSLHLKNNSVNQLIKIKYCQYTIHKHWQCEDRQGNVSCECLSGLSVPSISVWAHVVLLMPVSLCKSTSCKNQNINFLFQVCVAALGYLSDSDKTDHACNSRYSCFGEVLIHCQSLYLE